MKKEDFLKLGVPDDVAEKCEAAYKEATKDFVPRDRLKEVTRERDTAKADHAQVLKDLGVLQTQLKEADVEGMKQKISELETNARTAAEAHNAEIHKMKVDNAVSAALSAAGAINAKAVVPFITGLDKAEFAEDGTVKGLADQIKGLAENEETKFLFSSAPRVKGATPGGSENHPTPPDFSKMTYDQIADYLADNPE